MKNSKFSRSLVYYTLQGLQMLLSVFTNFYIIQKLSIEEFGYASLALSIVTTASVFVYQWTSSVVLYIRSKKDPDDLNEVIWSRNILLGITLIPTIILTIVTSSLINEYLSSNVTTLLFWLLIAMMLTDYFTNYLLAKNKQIISSFMGISVRITLLLLSVFFLKDLESFIIINLISNLIFISFIGFFDKKDFIPPKVSLETFKLTASFSLWQAVGMISLSGAQSIASIIINNVTTIEEVSYYNVSFKLISAIVSFESYVPLFFVSFLVGSYKAKDYSKLKQYFYKIRPMFILLALLCHVLVFITSDWFIPVIFGEEYIPSIIVFKFLLLYSFFYFIVLFYSQYANASYKYKFIQVTNIAAALVTILVALILTPKYGAVGYALANSIGLIIKFAVLFLIIEPLISKDCLLKGE